MKMDKKRNKRGLIAAAVLLALFGVLLGVVMYWENHVLPERLLQQAQQTQETEPDQSVTEPPTETAQKPVPTTEPEETQPFTLPAEPLIGEGKISILLTGQDNWYGEEQARSDATILCVFDTETDTLTMISFLRDMYLKIPGYYPNRLNATFRMGGFDLLNETLELNFGVRVDGNVEIGLRGFIDLIDYLGGVDMELTAAQADYLNENDYKLLGGSGGWDLSEGMNHLDGSQALGYCQIRYLDSDFGRTERQRNVLTALLERFQTATIQEVYYAVTELLEQSTSNLTDEELIGYALELYPLLQECGVVTQQIPADETYYYDMVDGMSVLQVDVEANREIIKGLIGDPEE